MQTRTARIHVAVDHPMRQALSLLAAQEGVSLSSLAHDLIREALELREDAALSELADERSDTLNRKASLDHESVWD